MLVLVIEERDRDLFATDAALWIADGAVAPRGAC
jgi:hypothetical protein